MINKKLLFELLAVQSASLECEQMQCFILDYLDKIGEVYHQDKDGNIYAGHRRNAPCIVAHMDTVHDILKGGAELVPVEYKGKVTGLNGATMQQAGIGGDDKCGIFAALTLLTEGHANAAFFVDEEIGCLGSRAADLEFFYDTLFILQADRRGNADFVTDISGSISSRAFQKDAAPYMKAHKYKPANGMMTDVMELSDRNVGISCANLSAGYYRPHMDDEYIVLKDLSRVIDLMRDLCTNLNRRYPHKRERRAYVYDYKKDYTNYKGTGRRVKTAFSQAEIDEYNALLKQEAKEEKDAWGDTLEDWAAQEDERREADDRKARRLRGLDDIITY